MNPKTKLKIAVDLLMTILLVILMAYQVVGDAAHEWVGLGMFACFLLHQWLNRSWYRALPNGRYSPFRMFQTALNALIFFLMIALMISGILLSETVFAFLNLHGGLSVARVMHLLASYWGFALMSLHVGLHWGMIFSMINRLTGAASHSGRLTALRLSALAVAVYGASAFFRNRIPTYLFLRSQFVFFDYSRPAALVFADYLAMMGTFIWLGYYGLKLSAQRKKMKIPSTAESEMITSP